MDARHFDALTQALTRVGARRGLLGLIAAIPILGGLFALFDAEHEADAKGRRQRRKKRHKHGKGRRQKHKPHKNKPCKPQPDSETCAGKCGSVQNTCKKAVDCGACTCDPACGACERCIGTTCAPCAPCCNDICCDQANAICHASSGACCVPEPKATTCEGTCGPVVNNCGVTVACGSCVCDPVCPTCQICDEDTGACVADPEQDGDLCGAAQSCDQGTVTPQGSCNASGTCVPADPVSCAPYALCDGSDACATTCGDDNDCTGSSYCNDAHHCVGDEPGGQPCDHSGQCASGYCVNDVCCTTACDGVCQACNLSGMKGTCTTNVGAACGTSTCAAGVLTPAPICQANGQCQSGAPISCTPYLHCDGSDACATTCGDDNDCTGSSYCNGAHHCVAKNSGGLPCGRDSECQSGSCVDSVCCQSACDPTCHTCSAPGSRGFCVPRTSGTPCGSGQICCCGACQAGPTCGTGAAFGAACTSDGDCASGLCGCTASDCAGGGICIDRYVCDPAGCFAADQSNYLIIHPGGDQLTCGFQSGGGGCPCPAGQVCHITASLCVIPYDVPVVTTPA